MSAVYVYVVVCTYCATVICLTLTDALSTSVGIGVGLAVVAGLGTRLFQKEFVKGFLFALAVVVIAFGRMAVISEELPAAFEDLYDTKQTLKGVVVALPDIREGSNRVVVEIRSGSQHTRVIAAVPLYPSVHVGDRVEVTGTLKHPKPFDTDGGRTFAYDDFLQKDGIFGVMQPAQVTVTGSSDSLWLWFLRVLEYLRATLIELLGRAIPDPESSLAVGVLVGGKQGLGKELLEAFTAAGMLQIVVLSGYNVMVVANALMRSLGGLPSQARLVVGGASIACFVLTAGAGSAALRAGLMALIAVAARTFGREHDVLRAVFASLFVLALWNPLVLVHDPGFQFSFVATIGLVLGTPIMTPLVSFLRNATIIEMFASTLAAEITLLPLLLWQTGHLSVVSTFANVAATPAIPFAMAASALAMLVAFPLSIIHPTLPLLAGLPAYLPLTYIIKIATLSASLPFATVIIPIFPFWVVLLSYAVLGYVYVRSTRRLRRENDAPPNSSSGSQGMPRHMTFSQPACNRP